MRVKYEAHQPGSNYSDNCANLPNDTFLDVRAFYASIPARKFFWDTLTGLKGADYGASLDTLWIHWAVLPYGTWP
jgi:hypothetical protein